MLVDVTREDLTTVKIQAGGTIWTMRVTNQDGNRITFASDWRPMRDLCNFVMVEGDTEAEIEDWQVVGSG